MQITEKFQLLTQNIPPFQAQHKKILFRTLGSLE